MNANNPGFLTCTALLAGALSLLSPAVVSAEQGLDSSAQSKVNNAKAKSWGKADTSKDGYQKQGDKRVVNIGSKRAGTCTVNVGTAQPGQKAPKEIVVTTKEVINVCK